MYIRFVGPWRGRRGSSLGMFRGACWVADDSRVHEALRLAVHEQLDWFAANLPSPKRRVFLVKSRGVWLSDGICWFLDDAREMIARAYALAALLGECGVPVTKVATRTPGQILYRDEYQIVARPDDGSAAAGAPAFSTPKMEADMKTIDNPDDLPCFRGHFQAA
jgi:hypothetical protein